MTLRDKVWGATLEQLIENDELKLSDLPFDESERHTVRRVLKQMERQDWLMRESKHAAIWKIGEKGRRCLDAGIDEPVKPT